MEPRIIGGGNVFVSHSSSDRHLTQTLAANLRLRGFDSLFIDFDPVGGIPPGRNWECELYTALRRSDAVVAIDTPSWRTSQWCFAEVALARSLGKTVIVLQIGGPPSETGAPGAAALTVDTQRFAVEELTEETCEPLYRELTQLGIGQLRSFRWRPERPPYTGLSPLQEEDAGVFFGRRQETRTTVDLIEKLAKYREKRMLLLIGPSGSGKSSLLRAGIIPQFRHRSGWSVVGPDLVNFQELFRTVNAIPPSQKILLALDQIEETLTHDDDGLVALLTEFVQRDRGSFLTVGTLRGESLTVFHERFGALSPLIEQFVVGPLTRADYREIIEHPAKVAGGSVDPALLDALLADIASSSASPVNSNPQSRVDSISADALPLLAVTLRQLWEQRTSANELTSTAYEKIGRLDGAIQRTAASVMRASVLNTEDLAGLRRAFVGMVQVDRQGRFSRRPLRLSDVKPRQLEVLQRFVNEGLLVIGSTPGCIDLAHEALIRTWKDLASWIEDAREDLLRLERFEIALAQWRRNHEAILQGIGLMEAEELAERGNSVLQDRDAVQLLELSRQAQKTAAAREHERLQSIRISESLRLASEARASAAAEPETALLVAWEAVLWDRNELTEAAFREALARTPAPVKILRPASRNLFIRAGFAGAGTLLFAADTQTGAVACWTTDGRPLGRFQVPGDGTLLITALPGRKEILTWRDQVVRLHDADGRILDMLTLGPPVKEWNDFSISVTADCVCLIHAGGQGWLVHVNREGNPLLRLIRRLIFAWSATGANAEDMTTGDLDGPLHPPLSRVFRATLDSESQTILTEGSDSARVWNLDGTLRNVLDVHGVSAGRFLAGGRIVTGTMSGAAQLWGPDGKLLKAFKNGTDGLDVFVTTVDPNAEHFAATVNRSGIIEIWSATGELKATLRGHQGHAWSAAFSADGQYLASGGADRTVRVWDWRQERCVFELHGHTHNVNAVQFQDSDATLLLSVCHEGEVRLWTLDTAVIAPLRGHDGPVEEMAFAAAGVLSSAADGTSRLWRLPQGDSAVLTGKTIALRSGHGRSSAFTADASGIARLWSWDKTGAPACHCEFPARSRGSIIHAAASPDLKRVVLVSESKAELWSDWGEHLRDLIGEKAPQTSEDYNRIRWTAFQQDGSRIMTAAVNGTVWLWSADGLPEQYFVADTGSPDSILDLAFDPQGDYILIGVRHRAGLWTWEGELELELPSSGYKVHKVGFAPDGSLIVTISDNPSGPEVAKVDLWSRAGKHLASPHAPNAIAILFDPQSRYFCLRSSADLRIFDGNGRLIGTLAAATGIGIRDVAISADGDLIAALFSDGKGRLWNFGRRRRAGTLDLTEAHRIFFTPDSKRLLAASRGGPIEQYALDITDLFPIAARRVDRMFTAEELDRFAIQHPVKLNLERFRRTSVSTSA